ncbi:SDR family oxidoreductase [Hyphomicrobium sp.]|uniref:SDR family oxidoreductase n=1 Tax=Hyphomicrobium sp. TaxID=82 RepID=UPI002D76CB3D|nr:SDR family oxidoreductase [Hyphomicrobium sp.]HET6389386.1 SDR family oxidoreductase [Hyphomicrobium sp.]
MKIRGATVFVTGANRGIGLAFAKEAVSMGAAKVYAGMRKTQGFSVPGIVPVPIDVTNAESVRRAAAQCGDVSIVVNNAGIGALVSDALDERVEAVARDMMEVNLYGIIRVTQAFAPILAGKPESAIINVLSDVSWRAAPVLTSYAASKAAAWSFTNNARIALKAQNTAVVGVHVGFVDTDLTAGFDVPKMDPSDVARKAYRVLEAGGSEVLADEGSVKLKASLSAARPEYIYPEG